MKIGFLISGIGVFGSVREVVENCNVLTDLGNECYLFNPEGMIVKWLDCKATVLYEKDIYKYDLDVLFLCAQPNGHYMNLFEQAKADKKIFVFMGFDINIDPLAVNPNLQKILSKYYITGDGYWQISYFGRYTNKIFDAQFGGINTEMFRPLDKPKRNKLNIGWSGDLRPRKGGAALNAWLKKEGIATLTYFNKGIKQNEFKNWFNKIDIFIDNHIWGGWCNPVAEAMACKVPVICSDILCNNQFATHEITALKFNTNDFEGLGQALKRMINDTELRNHLAENGYKKIQEFDYKIIGKQIHDKLHENRQSKY